MINGSHDSQLLIGESIKNLKKYISTDKFILTSTSNINMAL